MKTSTKDAVKDVLRQLPNDCSLNDVIYSLYVAERIEQSEKDIRAGRVYSHEQVVRMFERRWKKDGLKSNGRVRQSRTPSGRSAS